MHWDGYTTFSVLSGISIALVALLLPKGSASLKDRCYAFLAGAFFFGYGIYAGTATTGFFVFPVWIFVIPFLAVIYLVGAYLVEADEKK